MKRKFYRHLTGFMLLFLFMSLVGCGTNVFQSMGLVSEVATDSLEGAKSVLENASSPEDFTAAKETAANVINDSSASAEAKQEANTIYAEAILGENSIAPANIFSSVIDQASGTSTSNENLMNTLTVDGDKLDSLKAAADAYNTASSSGASTTLNANTELNRGVVNALVAVNMVTDVFDINSGTVTTKTTTDNKTLKDKIGELTSQTSGVTVYTDAAADGLNAGGALTDEQKQEVDNTTAAVDKLVDINAAINSSSSRTVTYNSGGSVSSVSLSSSSTDDEIEAALGSIFGDL